MRNLVAAWTRFAKPVFRSKGADTVCTWLIALALIYIVAQISVAAYLGRIHVQ